MHFDAIVTPERRKFTPISSQKGHTFAAVFPIFNYFKQTTNEETTFPDESHDAVSVNGKCKEGSHAG